MTTESGREQTSKSVASAAARILERADSFFLYISEMIKENTDAVTGLEFFIHDAKSVAASALTQRVMPKRKRKP